MNWTILKKTLQGLYRLSCQKGQIRIRPDQKFWTPPARIRIHNTGYISHLCNRSKKKGGSKIGQKLAFHVTGNIYLYFTFQQDID